MMAVALGLTAAMAWGIHDLCVRKVSQGIGIFSALLTVLAVGCVLTVPLGLVTGGWPDRSGALWLSLLSGVIFGLAGIALYKAFAIGPVRLVAPIIGAYPVLSIGWAIFSGREITGWQLAAVAVIGAGVGYVAASADESEIDDGRRAAVLWSIAAGTGFAATFALGQAAASGGGELALLGPTRLAALVTVLGVALALRRPIWPGSGQVAVLALMGALDAIALSAVISAGGTEFPEFASVGASTFGLLTVVLAAIFLGERLNVRQWVAVVIVFAAIGYLGH